MPRRMNLLLLMAILTIVCGQVCTARAQIRAILPGPIGPAVPVRLAPIAGPTLTPRIESSPRLLPSELSASPTPRIESRVPGGRTTGALSSTPSTEPRILPNASLDSSSSGSPPKREIKEAKPDGGGEEHEPKSGGVLDWVRHLPGWVWFLVILLFVAILNGSRK